MSKKKKKLPKLVECNGYEVKLGDVLIITTGANSIHAKGNPIKINTITSWAEHEKKFTRRVSRTTALYVEFINLITKRADAASEGYFANHTSFTAFEILKRLKEEND